MKDHLMYKIKMNALSNVSLSPSLRYTTLKINVRK
jgi:hypothetical protein